MRENTTMKKKEENKQTEEKEPIHKRLYNVQIECIKSKAIEKNNRVYAVLVDSDGLEYKHELKKETENKSNLKGDFELESHKVEGIKSDEILNYIPEVFLKINDFLKKHPATTVHISFSESTYFDNDSERTYRTMYKNDVETIYCPEFDENTEKLDLMLERQAKAEMNKKGKNIEI